MPAGPVAGPGAGKLLRCRRAGQGAVDEAHPLAIRGAWKKPFTGEADVVLAIGFKFWSGEKFGEPPTWSDKATYIQVDASAQRVGWHVPAAVGTVKFAAVVTLCCGVAETVVDTLMSDAQRHRWLLNFGTM